MNVQTQLAFSYISSRLLLPTQKLLYSLYIKAENLPNKFLTIRVNGILHRTLPVLHPSFSSIIDSYEITTSWTHFKISTSTPVFSTILNKRLWANYFTPSPEGINGFALSTLKCYTHLFTCITRGSLDPIT